MFLTPFLIGLAGSLHCAGMCSPLVMAVTRRKDAILKNFIYNLGRVLTYGVMGSLVSFFGRALNIGGIQNIISIGVGLVILFIALSNISVTVPAFISRNLTKVIIFIKTRLRLNPLLLGMVNGILPCGLTLIALAYCVTLSTPGDGFLAMIYFGMGTLPVMLGISLIAKSLVRKLPHIQTALMIISAIILIGRGIDQSQHDAHVIHIVVCGNNP
jgi:sulfite exporter TauE/SafE